MCRANCPHRLTKLKNMKFNLYAKSVSGKFLKTASSCLLTLAAGITCLHIAAQGTPGLVSCGYTFSGEQICNNGEFSCCSFTTISGATILATNTGMTNSNYTIDLSGLSPAFNFDFNGVTYNTFGVNTNGFVWLGATAPVATTNQPIALAGAIGTTPDGIISAWGAALEGSASGTLSYVVSGTSPNRTLTIQWANVRLVDFSAAMPGFQIILYENGGTNSNLIEFLYGDMNCDFIASNAADNIQIGLRGTTNADFNDLTGSGGNGFGWTAGGTNVEGQITTDPGTANTSGLKWHTEPFIWGNNKITYTPTITTPTITGGPTTWCAGSGGSVVLTANTTIASPTYQWQAYNYPPADSNIAGQTGSTFTANPQTAGIYLYVVQVTNASNCYRTSYADTITVTTCANACSPPVASYNNAVCAGDTLKLSASTMPNATYSWSGPNGFTSSSQDTFITNVTLADTGAYSVMAIYDTCVSTPAVVDVVINSIPSSPVAGSNSPVCTGDSIKLTASTIAGAVYNWTGPNNFSSNQNPVKVNAAFSDSGTYSVVVVVNGCSSVPATTRLSVNQTPVVPSVSSNTPLCAGDTLKLSAGTIANATYNWTGPNNFTNQQNPIKVNVTTSDAGTYSVVATVNGCKSAADNTVVVVNPIPSSPTASNTGPYCVGGTLQLNATTVNGATYNWTGPNNFANQQNPAKTNIALTDSGIYRVIITVNGCNSPAATTDVEINPIPAAPMASNTGPFCVGGTLQLNASTVNGATYNWTGPNNFTNQQNPAKTNIALTDSGAYSVVATVKGCNSPAAATDVVINPIPAAPIASNTGPYCVGGTLQLSATLVNGATYNWTGPNNFTNQQNPAKTNIALTDSGIYSVIATVNGCNSPAANTDVVIHPIPAAPTASNTGPYCAGGTLQLNATTVNGATYNWTGPNNFPNEQNPTKSDIALTDSGTYSVVITVNGCNSPAAATDVEVNPIPAAPVASSNSPVCTGETLDLFASNIANATYNWTGPNNFTNQQNPSKANVTIADSGIYSVKATVKGCSSLPATTDVAIRLTPSAPTASSNSPICAGDTMKLTASTIANATYNWTGPNNFSNLQNPVKPITTVADSGTYSVVVTVNGCNSPAASTQVIINFLPSTPVASSNSPLCTGDSLKLTASSIPNATYNWTGPNNFTNQQNPDKANVTSADAGTYSVIATVNGCSSAPVTTNVIVNPTPGTPIATSNSPICTGSALNLFADSINGVVYSWTGPNNFTANQRNPGITSVVIADSGTYTVIATQGICNSLSASTSVVIDLPPAAPNLSSNSPVCEGSSLTLGASNIQNATYNWTGPNSFISQHEDTGITNTAYADSGTYTVIATVGPCNSPAATVHVTVNETPVLSGVTSNSPVCYGTVLNLSADSITGATYSWTGPSAFSNNQRDAAISNVTFGDSGVYTLTATIGSCSGVPVSTYVKVNADPASPALTAGKNTICAGDSSQVCAVDTFKGYLWNTGAQGVSCIYAINAGNYWVTVTDANGCMAVSNHLAIGIYPVQSISVEEVNDTLIAFDGTHYQWYFNNTTLTGDTNSYYIATKTGTYTVAITDTNGCVALSEDIGVTVGIVEVASSIPLELYPNPSSNGRIEVAIGSECIDCDLKIFDGEGRLVYRSNVSAQKQEIDISSLAKGIYILQVAGDSRKFIVE